MTRRTEDETMAMRKLQIAMTTIPILLCFVFLLPIACEQTNDREENGDHDELADDDFDDDDDNDNNTSDDDDDDDIFFHEVDVFQSGQEGYRIFRIPSLIETTEGTLLAFCEGRQSISDTGDIDIVMKRSFDNGQTWSALSVVVDNGTDTAGNMTPSVDRDTGEILLPFCTNPANDQYDRRVFITRSSDNGGSWSEPIEITESVSRPEWTWYATGPGRSIQLESGRFIVPCDHRDSTTGEAHSHVIFSDDGENWQIGGVLGPDTDESQVAQLDDGSLIINMRDLSSAKRRWVARSYDEGETWTEPIHDEALPDPSCMGSLLQTPYGLFFSNPDSEIYLMRKRLTIRLSLDGGETWEHSKILHEGGAAYSALSYLPDGRIGLLYENGRLPFLPYERITFTMFSMGWLNL